MVIQLWRRLQKLSLQREHIQRALLGRIQVIVSEAEPALNKALKGDEKGRLNSQSRSEMRRCMKERYLRLAAPKTVRYSMRRYVRQ